MIILIDERLKKQIEFLVETDKMKNIYRQTYVLNEPRKENDAEHSWHLALLAIILSEHSDLKIDVLKVMKMVVIHDIVEIYAGDTYCYDKEGYKDKAEREEKSARRVFSVLPDDQYHELYNLWREFEDGISNEAKFSAVLDRVQPLTLNYRNNGQSWKEHNVEKSQVEARNCATKNVSEDIYEYINDIINDANVKGWLK